MMKKILTVLFAVALALSLTVFFAACGEKDENKGKENVITASLGKTEATVGEEVSVTYSATEGTVTVTYSKDGGAAVSFTGNTFTATEAGTYVFTFSADGAQDVTKTLTVKAAEPEPVVPVITAQADKAEIYAGGSVTLTWSATEDAAVTVSYTKDGIAATALKPESGKALTIGEAGTYVFTFSADGAESKTVTVVVKAKPVITVEVSEAEITEGESVTFTFSCSDQAAVSVAVKYNGAAETLSVVSGTPVTLSKVGTYVFTFSAENAADVEKTVTVRAHTHTYGEWTQVNAPTASSEGQIKRTCTFDGCENAETMTLPALTAENVAATATEGKYTYQETPSTCTQQGTGTYTFYIDTFKYTVDLPLAAHTYQAVTLVYADNMASDNWTCTVKCSVCGAGDKQFTVPKAVSAEAGSGWERVSVETQPSCVAGSGTYHCTVEQDEYTVTITVSGVTIPATGEHTYDDVTFEYSALQGEITAYTNTLSCKGGCGTTLTVQGLPAFDQEAWGVQVTNEPTCGEDGLATLTYSYTAEDSSGQSVTIDIIVTNVTVSATGEHSYVYALNTETGELGVTCSQCDYSSSYALSSVEITTTPEYLVMQSNGDIDLSAFTFTANFEGTSQTAAIPADSILGSAVYSNKVKYEETTVTFTFFGKSVTSAALAIYEEMAGGTVTANNYLPNAVALGTTIGTFEYRFDINDLTKGANSYNSWVIRFEADNGAEAALRADAFVNENFGRKADDIGSGFGQNGLTWEGVEWSELQSSSLSFIVARTYAEGVYTLTVTVTAGDKTAKMIIEEPTSNGNVMTVYLGGDTLGGTGSYDYSDLIYIQENLTVTSLTATSATVANGTSLDAAMGNVTVTAELKGEDGRTFTETVKDYTYECAEYDGAVADTYTVDISYRDGSAQTVITVSEYSAILLKEFSLTGEDAALTYNGVTYGAEGATFTAGATHRSIVISESVYEGKIADGLTLNLWATPQATGENWEALIGIYDDGASAADPAKYQHFRIGITGLDFGFNTNGGAFSGGGWSDVAGDGGLVDTAGKLTMYTIVFSKDSVQVFVNGVLKRTHTTATWGEDAANFSASEVLNMLNTYSNGIRLGGYWTDDTVTSFAGTMKDVSLYAGAMTADEIAAMYAA